MSRPSRRDRAFHCRYRSRGDPSCRGTVDIVKKLNWKLKFDGKFWIQIWNVIWWFLWWILHVLECEYAEIVSWYVNGRMRQYSQQLSMIKQIKLIKISSVRSPRPKNDGWCRIHEKNRNRMNPMLVSSKVNCWHFNSIFTAYNLDRNYTKTNLRSVYRSLLTQ